MRNISVVAAAAAFVLAAPAALAQGVKIGGKIPYADPAQVRDAIRKECDLEAEMSQFLQNQAKGMVEVSNDLKNAKGRVLDAKIDGVWSAPGPWGAATMQVKGELKDGGKVVGSFTSKRNTSRGGGACQKLMVSGNKIAEDIAEWLKTPTMDAKLGDAK